MAFPIFQELGLSTVKVRKSTDKTLENKNVIPELWKTFLQKGEQTTTSIIHQACAVEQSSPRRKKLHDIGGPESTSKI